MKRLIFMRHGFLAGKYSNYANLSFEDFEELLLKEVSPHIDKNKSLGKLNKLSFIYEVDLICCSSNTKRSKDTAVLVKQLKNVEIIQTPLLNEISFVKGVISRKDTVNFFSLREKILTSIYNSEYAESLENIKRRLYEFFRMVRNLEADTILCITHAWLMRFISLYKQKKLDNLSLEDLLNVKPANFLEEIVVEIT